MEGNPWTVEEENQLQQLLAEKKSVRVIARTMGKSCDCIRQKVIRLGLEVVVQEKKNSACTTTTDELPLPEELLVCLLLIRGTFSYP